MFKCEVSRNISYDNVYVLYLINILVTFGHLASFKNIVDATVLGIFYMARPVQYDCINSGDRFVFCIWMIT